MPLALVSVVMVLLMLGSAWAQPAPPDPKAQQAQQQKAQQYTQIEYQRCRADVLELWVKGDAAEQRVKELEDVVRTLTDELTTLRSTSREEPAKPAN